MLMVMMPREAVGYPPCGASKPLSMVLGTLLWVSLLERGLDKLEEGVLSNLSSSVIL